MSRSWIHWAPISMFHLRQQAGRREAETNAGAGTKQAVAGSVEDNDRRRQDGRNGHYRLLRATQDVARRAEQETVRLQLCTSTCSVDMTFARSFKAGSSRQPIEFSIA